jgi:DNA polymerase-3 subunit epsilon
MREIIFDTETTGLSAKTDRLIEIGCVEMIDRMPTGVTYHAYFRNECDIHPDAENVHGISAAFLADKPSFCDKVDELLEFLADSPLVAHNASFDFGFLNMELGLLERPIIAMERMVDTLAIARKLHPGAKNSLDMLCSRYGVDRSHRTKHGALLDAELLAQVYIELTGGRQIGLGLAPVGNITGEEPGADTAAAASTTQRKWREPRAHAPTAEELARHAAFIDRIDKPIWNTITIRR